MDDATLFRAETGETAAFPEDPIDPYRREFQVHSYRILGSFKTPRTYSRTTRYRHGRHRSNIYRAVLIAQALPDRPAAMAGRVTRRGRGLPALGHLALGRAGLGVDVPEFDEAYGVRTIFPV